MRCSIIGCFPPGERALNEYTYHLAHGLAKRLEEVTVLCDKLPQEPAQEIFKSNLKVIRCWESNSIRTPLSILKEVCKIKPDVVYLNIHLGFLFATNILVNAFCLLLVPVLLKISGFRVVTILHAFPEIVDLEFTPYKGMKKYTFFAYLLTRLIIINSHAVVVFSERYKELLSKRYGTTKIRYMPHGVFELISEPLKDKDKKGLLVFGKIAQNKDYELVLRAYEQVRSTDPDMELVIGGRVYHANPSFYFEVQKMCEKNGARFIGGVPDSELKHLFSESTLIILPYRTTLGVSGVLLQACGYGIPPIMPDLPELISIVEENGIKGFFYRPGDVESLVSTIKLALNDAALQLKISKHNLEVAKGLSFEKSIDTLLRITGEVVQS